jgi:hypothetical protein
MGGDHIGDVTDMVGLVRGVMRRPDGQTSRIRWVWRRGEFDPLGMLGISAAIQ